VPDKFYRPKEARKQSTTNRQGGSEPLEDESDARTFISELERTEAAQYMSYETLLKMGTSRELARIVLPVSAYTEWYWKCDLHNIFRFLRARMNSHAQQEIRDYAVAMFAILRQIAPIACAAFMDYEYFTIRFTNPELKSIFFGAPLATDSESEKKEFVRALT
jgi:thymidylate synthase (FAD)